MKVIAFFLSLDRRDGGLAIVCSGQVAWSSGMGDGYLRARGGTGKPYANTSRPGAGWAENIHPLLLPHDAGRQSRFVMEL